jgi:hypothetical protein
MCRTVATEQRLPSAPPPGLGSGWRALAAGADRELRRLDPPACAVAVLTADGALELVLYDPWRRTQTRALCEAVERAARTRCERCGAAGAVRAGPVTMVLCDACASRRRSPRTGRRG